MQNTHTHAATDSEKAVFTLDQCRAAFMSGIAAHFLRGLLQHSTPIPGMNRSILQQTVDQLGKCTREIRRNTLPHEVMYLDRNLKLEKLQDLSSVIEVISRIGVEEDERVYEEFLGLILDLIDEVFYAQKNRRKIYFPKYRALLELISKELRADVNEQTAQVIYQNKSLYFRTAVPEVLHTIK